MSAEIIGRNQSAPIGCPRYLIQFFGHFGLSFRRINSYFGFGPKFPPEVESVVAISCRSARARVFAATGARFRAVFFSPLTRAFGESCRYFLAK